MQEQDGKTCSCRHLQGLQSTRDCTGVVFLFIAKSGQAGKGVDDQEPMLLCKCQFRRTRDQCSPVVAD
jgi:hypothetical protein